MVFILIFSAINTKVPARGKALVPTDLSISVPEGTYARIGTGFNSFFTLVTFETQCVTV